MVQTRLSNYLSGIMNLASSLSTWIGPSYIEVECYQKEDALSTLLKDYHVPKEEYEWEEVKISFMDLLQEILGKDQKLLESIHYWINFHIGEPIKITTPKDNKLLYKMSGSEGGNSPFYIVDNLYWIEFKDYMVFFIIGNNE